MVVHHPFALRECTGLCQIEYSAARSHATVTAMSNPTGIRLGRGSIARRQI